MSAANTIHPTNAIEVVVERLIAAPPSRVFHALTDAAELEKWMFSDARTNPKVGGDYRIRWRSDAKPEKDHDRFGRYLEVVQDSKVVFEWRGEEVGVHGLQGIGTTIVSITLTPQAGGTLVRLVHTGWPDTDVARKSSAGHNDGWTFYMGNLERFLTGGKDLRFEKCGGQSVKATF